MAQDVRFEVDHACGRHGTAHAGLDPVDVGGDVTEVPIGCERQLGGDEQLVRAEVERLDVEISDDTR